MEPYLFHGETTFWQVVFGSGVVPANQTEESEVRELSGL